MLDNGTKKRIDSVCDILVGKVPDLKSQVEQITIAMIYKFMDDMDNQTEELGGRATFKEKAKVVANCDHLSTLKFSPSLFYAFTEWGAGRESNFFRWRI
ncbi:MAG: hypothetical protein ISS64_06840 [Desulfobacterales bacterium]|nr:hypothetical protein [Desulfobacterales bacterium]